MFYRKNEAGRYLFSSVTNGEGKRHRVFIPKERGVVRGWLLLAERLKRLGITLPTEVKKMTGTAEKEIDTISHQIHKRLWICS